MSQDQIFFYEFVEHRLMYALIIIRIETGKLVYASLGNEQEELLQIARADFDTLSKAHKGVKYTLTNANEAPTEYLDPISKIKNAFLLLMDGDYRSAADNIEYEYIFGTRFQRKVWNYLLTIGSGHMTTYGKIAEAIGSPRSVRAVGRACGQNKIALLIPCHRVVGQNGKLTGYRWSVDLKSKLLALERSLKYV